MAELVDARGLGPRGETLVGSNPTLGTTKMKIYHHIFRAYDLRGIYNKDINEDVFQKIGYFIGERNESFFVAHDVRFSSENLALALISGLTTRGAKKIFFGGSSFYGLALFTGISLKVDKIFFVTASHLPPEWNGLKPFWGNGEPFSSQEIQEIKEKILKSKRKIFFQKPKFKKVDLKKEYAHYLKEKFPLIKENRLKIVLDCGNGATSLFAPQVFQEIGFKVFPLFCQAHPYFPNRPSEPTPEALKTLSQKVREKKADFGVAFDGDGDRAVLIDNEGNYLGGNEIGIILAKYLLKEEKKNKKIVKTVACSMALEDELRGLGAKIIETAVGHTFVLKALKKEGAIFGFEESGHFVIPEYFSFDDGLVVPLKISEILLKESVSLNQIYKKIKKYPFQEKAFSCPEEKKLKIMKKIAQDLKKKYKRVKTLDGIKVIFKDSWVLIRPSNTSPTIRLYLEAKEKRRLQEVEKKFSQFLWKIIQ